MADKKKTIGIPLDTEVVKTLENKADKVHLKLADYCRRVLTDWAENDRPLNISEP